MGAVEHWNALRHCQLPVYVWATRRTLWYFANAHQISLLRPFPSPNTIASPARLYTAKMITRFLTEVRVTFNPFNARSKPARLFLSLIPPNARAEGMKIESKMLPRTSNEPASLGVKFSAYPLFSRRAGTRPARDYNDNPSVQTLYTICSRGQSNSG